MASSTPHTIALRGAMVRLEETAGEAGIKPGHLLEISSGEVIKNTNEDDVARPPKIALESPTAADSTTAAIDTAYADGDTVYYAVGQPGEIYYMWLETGSNAVVGVSQLVSAGTGAVKVAAVDATTLAETVIGVPAESLNNVTGSDARLKVMIS